MEKWIADLEKKMGKLQKKIKFMQEHPAVLGSPNNNCQNIIQKNNFIINDKKAGIVISRFHFFFFADYDIQIMAAQAPTIVFNFFPFISFSFLFFSFSFLRSVHNFI